MEEKTQDDWNDDIPPFKAGRGLPGVCSAPGISRRHSEKYTFIEILTSSLTFLISTGNSMNARRIWALRKTGLRKTLSGGAQPSSPRITALNCLGSRSCIPRSAPWIS